MSTEEGRRWQALGNCVEHISNIAQAPVHDGDGVHNCHGCLKIWGHHNRGEVGTVCMTHDYGPACHPDLTKPGEPNRGARVFEILTKKDIDRGWCAQETYYRLSCDGGETEEAAVDEMIGCVYAALAHRSSPPKSVRFRVTRVRRDP